MAFHWLSFLLGVGVTLGGIIAVARLVDSLQHRRKRRQDAAVEAWHALARDILGRLGNAPLASLNHEGGYLALTIESDGTPRDLTARDIAASPSHYPYDHAVVSAHLRLAFHAAVAAAVRNAPKRLLRSARYGSRDGRLLVSLYLPGPQMMERHSIWIGRLDGTDGRRAVFSHHPNDH